MANLKYDKILGVTVGDEKIKYGILYGNEKIVFIKVGADGNIRGYQDKYLKMAHRVHDRIGATVICASNSDLSGKTQLKADKTLIETTKPVMDRGIHYRFFAQKRIFPKIFSKSIDKWRIICYNIPQWRFPLIYLF